MRSIIVPLELMVRLVSVVEGEVNSLTMALDMSLGAAVDGAAPPRVDRRWSGKPVL